MRYTDSWDWQQIHDRLSDYLRGIRTAKILALTSPEQAEAWGKRTHCRSLRASGTRMVGEFTPETRRFIEQKRAEGSLR